MEKISDMAGWFRINDLWEPPTVLEMLAVCDGRKFAVRVEKRLGIRFGIHETWTPLGDGVEGVEN